MFHLSWDQYSLAIPLPFQTIAWQKLTKDLQLYDLQSERALLNSKEPEIDHLCRLCCSDWFLTLSKLAFRSLST